MSTGKQGDVDRQRQALEALAQWVPRAMPGAAATPFRLDPLSVRLLGLCNGRATVAELAAEAGEELVQVAARLKALYDARLIAMLRPGAVDEDDDSADGASGTEQRGAELAGFRPGPADARDGAVDPTREELPRKPEQDDGAAWVGVTDGDLAAKPGLAVLDEAATTRLTGGIRFEREGERIEVHFKDGKPLGALSDAPRHEHGAMLLAAGRITSEQHAAYRAALEGGAPHEAAALMQAGLSDRKELAKQLLWRGSTLLKEVAGWTAGRYSIAPGQPFPAKVAQLPLLVPRKRRVAWRSAQLDAEQLAFLEEHRSRYLVASPTARQVIAGMGLGDKEERFVEHVLDAPLQLSKAFATSTLFRTTTRTLLYHLIKGGALELHETNPAGDQPFDLDELEPYVRRLEHDNHFNVLTVHPVSTSDEIAERYQKRRAVFEDRLYRDAGPEHLAALAKIRARLDAAFAVLADAVQRRAYRAEVCSRDQLYNFIALQLRKAEVELKMRLNPAAALPLVESALDMEPASAEARLLLAEVLAQLGRTREARDALRAIGAVPQRLQNDYQRLRAKLG